jgi:hypothetical protein
MFVQVPWEDVAETKSEFAGTAFEIVTPVAVEGPWFVAWIVNVILLPTTTGSGAAEVVIARSTEFGARQQSGSSVVIDRVHPPAMLPKKLAVSSNT